MRFLPADSQEFLANLRANPRFKKLLDDVEKGGTPPGSPHWTPDNKITNEDRIYHDSLKNGFIMLLSLLRG